MFFQRINKSLFLSTGIQYHFYFSDVVLVTANSLFAIDSKVFFSAFA